jgi:mono/diheme cytochrome c family protein
MKNIHATYITFSLLILVLALNTTSCVKHPDSPGYEYFDDMTRSQAIEAYIDYGLVGDKVNDTLKNTISARIPSFGTIPYNERSEMAEIHMPFNYGSSEEERIRAGAEVKLPLYYTKTESAIESNINEGKRLYGVFCSHCHGDKGAGDGKVITVGGYPAVPPAYNTLKDRTPGSVFHTITHGKNAMGPHGSQLNKDERWKVAMYVRTMQFDGELNLDALAADTKNDNANN